MVVEVNDVFVMQGSVQFDFSVNLSKGCKLNKQFKQCRQTKMYDSMKASYLFPLVRFGNTRVWNDFGCIHFARAQICKFIAFGKTALQQRQSMHY